jgi:hypothetical protein
MSNYSRMLIKRLSKPDAKTPLRPDQIELAYLDGADSIDGCKFMAHLLFMLIREHHGEQCARRIFAMWGKPPSPRQRRRNANFGLLIEFDMMQGPNVQQLARKLAEENKALPRGQQNGAGCTDPVELAQQIRRQIRTRKKAMARHKWYGPMPVADEA